MLIEILKSYEDINFSSFYWMKYYDANRYYATHLIYKYEDTPIAVGEALKRYDTLSLLKEFIENILSKSPFPVGKAYNKK